MSATAALAFVMATWLAIGMVTGRAMGRRGHDGFTWLLLGATLGPLVVPLALSTWRSTGPTTGAAAQAWPREPGRRLHNARVSLIVARYGGLAVVADPASRAATRGGGRAER